MRIHVCMYLCMPIHTGIQHEGLKAYRHMRKDTYTNIHEISICIYVQINMYNRTRKHKQAHATHTHM